jgi:hypothetical protein
VLHGLSPQISLQHPNLVHTESGLGSDTTKGKIWQNFVWKNSEVDPPFKRMILVAGGHVLMRMVIGFEEDGRTVEEPLKAAVSIAWEFLIVLILRTLESETVPYSISSSSRTPSP